MKTIIYFSILATSVFMFASCSSNSNEEVPNDNGRKQRMLTVVPKAQPGTRSSLTDQGSQGLSSMWEMGDEMTVYNKTYPSSGYHTIKATSTSKAANFVGTADCEVNDQLRLFYPSLGTKGAVTDPAGNGTLTLDISEQKGTLEDIQQHYDFFYGEATVGEVTDNAAVANAELSQNLTVICKFTFKCNKEYLKDISSVEVTNVAPKAAFALSSRTTPILTPSAAGTINVVATDNIDNSVYVTLFPGETVPSFTVMAADGKYEGALSAATLQAGKFYNVVVETARTGEGSVDSGSNPDYVEVCGIKWAKGNLEYDPVNGGDPGFMENWRIAPTQWHFVGYDKGYDININIADEPIKDKFWWNNILSPFDPTSNNYKSSGAKIDGKLSKTEYLKLAANVTKYVNSNKRIPNNEPTKLGKVEADLYIYAFTCVLNSYSSNKKLPSSVSVKTKTVRGGYSYSLKQGGKILNCRELFDSESFAKYLKTGGKSALNDALKKKAKSLTKGLTSPLAKAIAIFRFVRDDVTYSFYSNSRKGAAKTFSTKSGNCCDKANLIVAMCRSVGVYARYSHAQGCKFQSGLYTGHVWAQVYDTSTQTWYSADATSFRNEVGTIKNWNTGSYYKAKNYALIPF